MGELRKRSNGASDDEPEMKRACFRTSQHEDTCRKTGSLEDLSPDIFCNILSCLGPTSQSLVSLSMVNKHFRKTVATVGNAMLPRAQSHFRKPLAPKSPDESSMSLFLRHSRICSKVLSDLSSLRKSLCANPDSIQSSDVDRALNKALQLLEIGPALSVQLERMVLATAGKCGGKVFKYSKSMLKHHRVTASDDHQKRLQTSRLIMQMVVCRELELSEQNSTSINTFVQKQIGLKQCQPTGCF